MGLDDARLSDDPPLQQVQPAEVRHHICRTIVLCRAESSLENRRKAIENHPRRGRNLVHVVPRSANVLDPGHGDVEPCAQRWLVAGICFQDFGYAVQGGRIFAKFALSLRGGQQGMRLTTLLPPAFHWPHDSTQAGDEPDHSCDNPNPC